MKIVAIIPAKGNSNRLPNKNIICFKGKPMLYWAINACLESCYDIDVYVNSDSKVVLDIAKSFGANVVDRDLKVTGDNIFKQEIIRSTVFYLKNQSKIYDIVISLQANSPQIKGVDLDQGIDKFIQYNLHELFSVDRNLMQNAAFRIMKWSYVFQRDLSTNCGVVVCDLKDIHTKEDMEEIG